MITFARMQDSTPTDTIPSDTTPVSIIRLQDVQLTLPDAQFSETLNWSMQQGEHWALIGPNGSGKSRFVDVLTGKLAIRSGMRDYPLPETLGIPVFDAIKSMAFRDITALTTDYEQSAYQQRWNSQESETAPDVSSLLKFHSDEVYTARILDVLEVRPLLNRKVVQLSSGELRKFLLARVLMERPRVLILDNPFIGLDAESRIKLNEVLEEISVMGDLQLLFVLSNPDDVPDYVHWIQPLFEKHLLKPCSPSAFASDKTLQHALFPLLQTWTEERSFEVYSSVEGNSDEAETATNVVVGLRNVGIHYGERSILEHLNWTVHEGERWALLGPNGAGKSTLLSLICADNPQSYANDIRLFGRKRGGGESIWDIKQHIGYVSPEMHHYYLKNLPCRDIVGSGLFDTIGLYRRCNEEQLERVAYWMERFGVKELSDRSFLRVSSGEQRLCLLARAFVKAPRLLILDEPLHGLDATNKRKVRQHIDEYCADPSRTLIYVTHYLGELPQCITKQFVLKKNT